MLTRSVVDLLIDQIEFCDVLILNKCDMVKEEDLLQLEGVLRKLQPRAKLIRTSYGRIAPQDILNTGRFDFDAASQSAGWIQELQLGHHTPETEEYGIASTVYRRKKPFHPERLTSWLEDFPDDIVRAKGLMWLASRNEMATNFNYGIVQSVGRSKRFSAGDNARLEDQEFIFMNEGAG